MIGPLHGASRIPERERLDTLHLANILEERGVSAAAFEKNPILLEALLAYLQSEVKQSYVVCFFTNGSFDGIVKELVSRLTSGR